MRIACVGGAGAMGARAVRLLSEMGAEVLVLDRDEQRGQALADGTDGACFHRFDVQQDALAEHLAGVDVVLNTLGPFAVHGLSVMRQSIGSGVNYVDINDDWEPTIEALALHGEAEQRGVTALVGMGASPGVSNVLARRAAAGLDRATTLITGWALGGAVSTPGGARPSAAMLHLVRQTTGTVRVLQDGVMADVRPLRRLILDYPGIGPIATCTVGHPEPITLPRSVPGLDTCLNVMSGPTWWFDGLTERAARVERGELTAFAAALQLEEDPLSRPAGAPATVRTPTIWAVAYGQLDGAPHAVSVGLNRWPEGNMAAATATPAAAAARLVATGQIDRAGVVTPEEVLTIGVLMPLLEPWYTLPDPGLPMLSIHEGPHRFEG